LPVWGGDEFVALLIDSPAEGLTEALNHLRQRLADEGGHDGPTYELRCSIGRAKYDPSGEPNLAALMAAADQQMYRDKAGRR
jgi:diguanylate cyclase (GGDEF)-like protein